MLRYVQRTGERSWFERPEDMSPVLHRLLIQRGIASEAEARAFLNPCAAQLHDPFLLSGMRDAVSRIRSAVESGEHICVYGDYDVDGVCASAILSDYLREAGADVEVYLPSRHEEGYGLNEGAVRAVAQRAKLLVTVDCGIASRELIALAMELGLDCVVTDHHRPGDAVPECTVINPLLGDYPFRWLCGAGVAFKLVWALGGETAAMARADLAAIATVADVVSLTGENRVIVRLGLEAIRRAPRPGVAAMMERARIEPGDIRSEDIAFRIAPRLNAGGRLGSARRSYEILMQEDAFLAVAQADELEQENARRQTIEREIRAEAEAQLRDLDFGAHRILLVRGAGWNPGVIGLTASHLREKYNYPVVALSEAEGVLTGSCRSIDGVDIYRTLCAAADLLERFGGHAQAAGLTLRAENFDALWAALDKYLFESAPPEAYVPSAAYDVAASIDEFTEASLGELHALEPTGSGNPEPVFRASVNLVEARAIGAQGAHLRLICAENGARRTGVYFGAGEMAERLGEQAEILFTPQLNRWNGRSEVQLRLSALREADDFARIAAAEPREGAMQRRFLTELFYNRGNDSPRGAAELDAAGLRAALNRGAQGTYIVCARLEDARRILEAARPCALDLHIDALPADARAFNALIVCPESLEGLPKALRRLVLAGVPEPAGIPEGVEILRMGAGFSLSAEIPDVDQLREVCRAALYLSRRPVRMGGMEDLCQRLSEESALGETMCLLSLLVLMDMKLVQIQPRPFQLKAPPMKKTDPDSSALWRALGRLKRCEGRDRL